ncbi:hypothetical protein [Breoghania sp.]|uniref:hypothetical protein n=1 Tax=Breoghania sp. TaxID=2065378 RepID=UPI0029C9E5D2|nr:hypothetical protein [Breoghania sp.]
MEMQTETDPQTLSPDTCAWQGPAGLIGCGPQAEIVLEALVLSGNRVRVLCRKQADADRMIFAVARRLAERFEAGALTSDACDEALGLISDTYEIEDLGSCGLVLDVSEDDPVARQALDAEWLAALPALKPLLRVSESEEAEDLSRQIQKREWAVLHLASSVPGDERSGDIRTASTAQTRKNAADFLHKIGLQTR